MKHKKMSKILKSLDKWLESLDEGIDKLDGRIRDLAYEDIDTLTVGMDDALQQLKDIKGTVSLLDTDMRRYFDQYDQQHAMFIRQIEGMESRLGRVEMKTGLRTPGG